MEVQPRVCLLLSLYLLGTTVSATVFTLENHCSFTVWPGILSSAGAVLGDGGFELKPGASVQLTPQAGWSGRFWGRTGCNFSSDGVGKCTTGDCGALKCTGGGVPPVTLAEFTLNGYGNKDFYDISLVDGYNVGMGAGPSQGSNCPYAGCVTDLNTICPAELQVKNGNSVVACKSACMAFNTPEYCCSGALSTPDKCSATKYSQIFKSACPAAYSYAYDDASSTWTCTTGANYQISFCPTRA